MTWDLDDAAPSAGDYRTLWLHGPRLIFVLVSFVFMIGLGGFWITKYFAPRQEALRREVYEESKSYRDGTIRDLDNLRLEWMRAEGAHKTAIAATARHRAADFPRDELPERVREWLGEIDP